MEWILAYASVEGASHRAEGDGLQDACIAETLYDGSCGVAVVADGAGSAAESAYGAKAATDSAVYHFTEVLRKLRRRARNEPPDVENWDALARETVAKIREDVCEKYARVLSDERGCVVPPAALASTLLVCLFLENALLFARVGDGRAGYCDAEGVWRGAVTPYKGEYANATAFLTSDALSRAPEWMESAVIPGGARAFCLLSDGCERAAFECNVFDNERGVYHDPNRPFPPFFEPNCEVLQKLYARKTPQNEINALWSRFLTDGLPALKHEPDDKTLILGVRV